MAETIKNSRVRVKDGDVYVIMHPETADTQVLVDNKSKKLNVKLSEIGTELSRLERDKATKAVATQSANGLMSSTDKIKLDGVATGAEVNQNAFSNVKVGSVTVAADTKTDTLEIVAGTNIGIVADAATDKITINNTYSHPTNDGNKHVPANGTTNNGKFLQSTATAGTYQWADLPLGTTGARGIVQLTDSINSTSTTTAATPNSVKQAYDKANHSHAFLPLTGGTLTGPLYVGGNVEINKAACNFIAPNNYGFVGRTSDGKSDYLVWMNTSNQVVVGNANRAIKLDADYPIQRGGHKLYHQGFKPTHTEVGASKGRTINATTAATANWYRIATSAASIANCIGDFTILAAVSGTHSTTNITAGISYGISPSIQQIAHSAYSTSGITKARIVYHTTYTDNYAYLEVYVPTAVARSITVQMSDYEGWTLVAPSTVGSIPSGYTSKEITLAPGKMVADTVGTSSYAGALATARTITLSGAMTGSASFKGDANITITTTHKTSGVTAGTYPKVTVNTEGHVTGSASLVAGDIPSLTHDKISDFDAGVRTNRLNEMAAPSAVINMNNQKITNVANASSNGDAVNLGQMNTAIGNVSAGVATSIHPPVNTVTEAKAIVASNRNDKMLLNIETHGLYRWDLESAATPDDNKVIKPNDVSTGTGRWVKMNSSINDHNNLDSIQGGTTGQYYHLTSAQVTKVDSIASGAQVNQNAFSNIAVSGQTTVAADTVTDTLTLAGTGLSITTNASTDTITIAHPTSDGNKHVPANGTANNGKFLQSTATAGTYQWATLPSASTTVKGIVQLENGVASTSTTLAATANAVKTAYDKGNAALARSGGTMTGNIAMGSNSIQLGSGNAASIRYNATTKSIEFVFV